METICLKCLSKEPQRRYASAQALAEDLERWLTDEPIQARRVTARERAWLWRRRKPALAGLALTLVVTLVVGTTIAGWRIAVARSAQQREQYYSNIALADHHINEGDIDRALELLLKCPARYRQWEWGRLMYLCHQTALTFLPHKNVQEYYEDFSNPPIAVLFSSPDGTRWLTLGNDGAARVWSGETGRELFNFGSPSNRVAAAAFSPDGKQVALGCANRVVRFWETLNWRELPSPATTNQKGGSGSEARPPQSEIANRQSKIGKRCSFHHPPGLRPGRPAVRGGHCGR